MTGSASSSLQSLSGELQRQASDMRGAVSRFVENLQHG